MPLYSLDDDPDFWAFHGQGPSFIRLHDDMFQVST